MVILFSEKQTAFKFEFFSPKIDRSRCRHVWYNLWKYRIRPWKKWTLHSFDFFSFIHACMHLTYQESTLCAKYRVRHYTSRRFFLLITYPLFPLLDFLSVQKQVIVNSKSMFLVLFCEWDSFGEPNKNAEILYRLPVMEWRSHGDETYSTGNIVGDTVCNSVIWWWVGAALVVSRA